MSRAPRPAISVVLPVRNAARFLDDCLETLRGQTLTDFEIVAVDDGSTDETPEILAAWRAREPRLRTARLERGGLINALNRGLELARAPLVARMDADDRSYPERLELQLAALQEHPDLDVVSCRVRHFSDTGELGEGLQIYDRWLNRLITHAEIWRERFIESPLPHPSVMARRDTLAAVGGYRDRGWPEDYDLWLRLAERGCRFGKVPRTLLEWRDHPDRLTRRDGRYAVERFLACKAHHLARGPLAKGQRPLVWGAGQTGRRLSKHLIREGRPPVAFIDIDPKKWGRTMRGAPVHPPEDLGSSLRPGIVVLAAVSSRGARQKIRDHLDRLGLVETVDYWCVA